MVLGKEWEARPRGGLESDLLDESFHLVRSAQAA
jgi:hypothetical protein